MNNAIKGLSLTQLNLSPRCFDLGSVSSDPAERHELVYLLHRADTLRPLSACGFFSVERSALTSMLATRWADQPTSWSADQMALYLLDTHHNACSLTYIIILVQFRLSVWHKINIPSGQSSAKLPVTLSLGHSVIRSLGHSVTRSLSHLVTRSLGHSVTIFNIATDKRTDGQH